ncbi:plasmid stabilization protein [Pararhizobium sp.]|uniref:plasmid stabilization protein n=1 Tax=Pararhizobium sp. TaxID=1977563 RepID=UPI003FA6EA46
MRNIPDALKKKLAASAERPGLSLSEKAKELLWRGIVAEEAARSTAPASAWTVLRATLLIDDGDEFAKIMDEIETERKSDFGRPLESFE